MLAVRALTCRRGERLVFADLDFAIPPGGAALLRGSNGSGKKRRPFCLSIPPCQAQSDSLDAAATLLSVNSNSAPSRLVPLRFALSKSAPVKSASLRETFLKTPARR